MSAAYRQLYINTSRERMEYADYPMPKHYPDFPHHTHIAEYFDAYTDHFGLREHVRFETRVERAVRDDDGTWELTLPDGSAGRFDALLVANGHHWDARWPEPAFPGADTFAGTQIHAHDYRDDELFRDKDVVVLGMGNSAMDLAVESSYVADHTYLSARRGVWIVPKYIFGRPTDQLPNDPRVPFAIRLAVGDLTRFGLPEPDHKLGHAHPTVSGRILDRIQHGAITPKPNIARLHAEEVEFTDGTRVHADVVVYCTGYKISFPFFDEGFVAAPDNHIELFRRVFVPGLDNLFFVALLQPIGAMMPLAEAQGKWIADFLCGDYALPSEAQMRADIAADQAAMRKRYVASKRHTIQVDFDDYMHALDKERRAGAKRAAGRQRA
jgi:dimethylaniline monooxygenase (N-oxide forming)